MSRSNETKPDTTGGLRRRAEIVLQGRVLDMDELSTENVQQMIHELQVHKIELEIQNEELRQTQLKLAETRDHFVDLYNFAPVGYCTINDKGVIVQANLTLALMLGVDRGYLLKKPIASFVAFADQDKLFLFQRQVLRAKTRQLCELQFVKKDGALLDAEATWRSYLPEAGDWKRTAFLLTGPLIIVSVVIAYLGGLTNSGSSLMGMFRPTIVSSLVKIVHGQSCE